MKSGSDDFTVDLHIGADGFEPLQETIFWLSQPGIRETIAEAKADIAAGRTFTEDEVRARYGA